MADDFRILLSTAINISESQKKLNSQIEQLKTESLKVGVELDTKSAKQAIKQLNKEQENAFKVDSSKIKLNNNISTYIKNNTKLSKSLKEELIGIQSQIKSADGTSLKKLQASFGNVKSEAEKLGRVGDTTFTKLGKNIGNFVQFLGAATVTMQGIRAIQGMISEVKSLDSAMISLKKVTNETNSTYSNFLTDTAQKAKELGTSISDLVNATADFARLGYTLTDSSKLAEVASLYENVGDGINIGDATNSIISTLKAFNIEASNSIQIIDKFNEVGKLYAQAT